MEKLKFYALLGCIFLSLASFSVLAPQGAYQPGDVAKAFNLINVDGKMVSLKDHAGSRGAIVIFTCNHCPFSVAYEDRIIELHKKYADKGYPVIAINSNDSVAYPDDSFGNMVLRAREKNFPFKYLYDESQEIARAYGAARTPHVFVLQRRDESFIVKYIGAIDDNTDNPAEVKSKYVENAVNELIERKEVSSPFTKAIGCSIKWKK